MPYRNEPIVTLATFRTEFEASLARGALEAIGIKAMVPGEDFGTYARYTGAIREFDLKVFESDRARAVIELRRLQIRVVEPPEDEA
jgi:hypothetical protein